MFKVRNSKLLKRLKNWQISQIVFLARIKSMEQKYYEQIHCLKRRSTRLNTYSWRYSRRPAILNLYRRA